MTAVPGESQWDAQAPGPQSQDAVDRLSQMVAGNDNLVTQPGLALALYQGNATPPQAQAINQFVGGLNAELAVRKAAAAGTKINLSTAQTNQLDVMGIDYSQVVNTPQDQLTRLKQLLAKKGASPVIGPDGQPEVNANGDVKIQLDPTAQQLKQKIDTNTASQADIQQAASLGLITPKVAQQLGAVAELNSMKQHEGFADRVGNDISSGLSKAAGFLMHGGHIGPSSIQLPSGIESPIGLGNVGTALNRIYNLESTLGPSANPGSPGWEGAQIQNDSVAKQLGYDPSSYMSMLAFKAHGYTFGDTSGAASDWDSQNPSGKFGWDGQEATTQAELFVDNPTQYRNNIVGDQSLTPEQIKQKIAAISSPDFEQLVHRVVAEKQDLGTDIARDSGIDPVKHPTLFKVTAASANFAAQMATDPSLLALGAYHAYQMSSVGIKGFEDAAGIADALTAGSSTAQKRVAAYVNDMVDIGKQAREADAAGDSVKLAQVQARANANPYGGLLSDFMGKDQILGWKNADEATGDESEFVTGAGKPIDTFDEAVDYIAGKGALGRLTGGAAPMEFSTMPGAVSSRLYSKIKGDLTSWSAGVNASRTEGAITKYIGNALADPDKLRNAIDNKLLLASLPAENDAVDLLSGQVLAAQDAVKEAVAKSDQLAEVATKANTDVLAGDITDDTARGIAAEHASSLDAADLARSQLASAQRAFAQQQLAAATQQGAEVTGTDALRGELRYNQLRYGSLIAPESTIGRLASIWTLGAYQRSKVLIGRVMNWLPNDLTVNVNNPSSAEDIRRAARTYMSSGDSNLLAMQWQLGTDTSRKTIIQGLRDQLYHAAGLSRSSTGRQFLDQEADRPEAYSVTGNEITDRNGANSAIAAGQIQTEFRLPNFGAIHKVASKIGLLESLGALTTKPEIDKFISFWRVAILASPTTANRAVAESWINAVTKHLAWAGLGAKAIIREGERLEVPGLAQMGFTKAVARLPGLADLGRIYRHIVIGRMPEAEARAVADMPDDLLVGKLAEQSSRHYAQEVDPGGVDDASEIAANGYEPHKVTWGHGGFMGEKRTMAGYERTDELDAIRGANAYAFTLGAYHNKAPKVMRAILDHLAQKPGADLDSIVNEIESGASGRLMRHSNFGKFFTRDDGTQAAAITDDEKTLAKQQWAAHQTAEVKDLISGRNGVIQTKLVDYLYSHDIGPDADWIMDSVKGMNRPQSVLRPMFMATPDGLSGTRKAVNDYIAKSILEPTGKGYQYVVERNIQRMATAPLFAAAYGKAKVGLEDYKQFLIDDQGYSGETAERITANKAARRAWDHVRLMVDDPKLRDQLDVTGRSFFAFSRATTTMLRRWAVTLWRDPAQGRRLQLAAEGAVNAGLVYKDPTTGQWEFLLPGSGIAQEVLYHAMSHIPGLEGLAQFPVSDFVGNVASIIPGSNNPFQYNTNPIVSIAGRQVASIFPNSREVFDEVDQKLNGSQGEGQGIVATLMPRALKNMPWGIFGNSDDDRNGLLTSAMVGSLYNLYAAGKVPPDGASPSAMDDWMSNLRTGTKTQLFMRALVGDISPATIYNQENENSGTLADFAYAYTGTYGLHNEYKQILNEVGGDVGRATAIWTYLHPDKTVYEQGSSSSMTKDAVLDATQAAYNWMGQNSGFINRYKSVAGYFVPEQASGEQFSEAAWRAQLEDGLREKKTPQEFLNAVRVAGAAAVYYPMEDEYESDLTKAKLAGNTQQASVLRQQWAAWSKTFKSQHQTFAAKTEASPENLVTAQAQMADLKQMVKNGDVPGGPIATEAVSGMVQAWEGYHEYRNAHPGTTTAQRASNAEALQSLQTYMNGIVAAVPSLNDLYSGVFRSLTPQLDYDGTDDSG